MANSAYKQANVRPIGRVRLTFNTETTGTVLAFTDLLVQNIYSGEEDDTDLWVYILVDEACVHMLRDYYCSGEVTNPDGWRPDLIVKTRPIGKALQRAKQTKPSNKKPAKKAAVRARRVRPKFTHCPGCLTKLSSDGHCPACYTTWK